jgi:hypothetical protein
MSILKLFTVLGVVTALLACSDTPSNSKLQQVMQQQYDQQYQGLIEVEQLKKLNGWADGDSVYSAEVSYTISFNKSFKTYMDEQTAKPGNPLEKMAKGMSAGLLKLQYGDFNAGDEYQVQQQRITLKMTENGWVLAD